jgi:hypothetical protein
MPKKRIADMNRSERIRYKQLEGQRERRFRRKMALADTAYQPPAHITLHPVPSLQTPTDTGYLDYREGLKLQRLIEQRLTLADTDG